MKTLVIPAVLGLIMTLAPVAASAGENPVNQTTPALSQQVNDTQLDQFKGRLGDPVDFSSQASRFVPSTVLPQTLQIVGDTVNFSENVMGTLKGYNTHPSNLATGPTGSLGPGSNVGPSWLRGPDITVRAR